MEGVYHTPEDFASDETFVNYCFQSDLDDVRYWNHWLNINPEKREAAERARALISMVSVKMPFTQKQQEWDKMELSAEQGDDEMSVPPDLSPKRWAAGWVAAAVLLLLVTGGIFSYLKSGHRTAAVVEPGGNSRIFSVPPGHRELISLDDGTRVWLNGDSKLSWNEPQAGDSFRECSLNGEAYFEVASDPERPFILHAPGMKIRVLGTSFNVKAYPHEDTVETALIRGSIEVSLNAEPGRKIILKPEQKITFYTGDAVPHPLAKAAVPDQRGIPDSLFVIRPLSMDPLLDSGSAETAWMKGKLLFRSETFYQLAIQLERKYDVIFHFTDDSVGHYRFTGIFSRETIGEALHALKLTSPSAPFSYRVDGRDIYIQKAG